ncbi:NifU family protein [Kitasatospora azatica]|uniref:NifU family protein n=1 Tax=Kitasatospora azatica TaxID=58347 RepID=UPI00055D72E0|nr:NifU family protein [Kitasatospora azatica]
MSAVAAAAPVRAVNAEQVGRRIEEILDQFAAGGDRDASAAAEELVRVLMEFYGAGLARIVDLLGSATVAKTLLDDELVANLLVLHELHPEDLPSRIARALAHQPVEVVDFAVATGTLRVRSTGGGCGCPSTSAATRETVADALAGLAPEVTSVELEGAAKESALLQISTRAPGGGS